MPKTVSLILNLPGGISKLRYEFEFHLEGYVIQGKKLLEINHKMTFT